MTILGYANKDLFVELPQISSVSLDTTVYQEFVYDGFAKKYTLYYVNKGIKINCNDNSNTQNSRVTVKIAIGMNAPYIDSNVTVDPTTNPLFEWIFKNGNKFALLANQNLTKDDNIIDFTIGKQINSSSYTEDPTKSVSNLILAGQVTGLIILELDLEGIGSTNGSITIYNSSYEKNVNSGYTQGNKIKVASLTGIDLSNFDAISSFNINSIFSHWNGAYHSMKLNTEFVIIGDTSLTDAWVYTQQIKNKGTDDDWGLSDYNNLNDIPLKNSSGVSVSDNGKKESLIINPLSINQQAMEVSKLAIIAIAKTTDGSPTTLQGYVKTPINGDTLLNTETVSDENTYMRFDCDVNPDTNYKWQFADLATMQIGVISGGKA